MRRTAALCLALVACAPAPGEAPGGEAGAAPAGGSARAGGGGGGSGGSTSNIRRITALAVSPAQLTLKPGQVSGFTCTATFDDGSTADVSGSVTWSATLPAVADVAVLSATDNLVRVEALSAGATQIVARTGALSSPPVTVTVADLADAGSPSGEVRGVWVTRFAYANANPATAKATITRIMSGAAAGGYNVVYFQVRGNGDAYYRSAIVPWAKALTGTLGRDPGWDPLQFAIDEAHARGLQLHAYFNAFTAWTVPSGCAAAGTCSCVAAQGQPDSCVLPEAVPAGAPEHWLRAHPDALVVNTAGRAIDGEYYWFSPANLAYRAHLIAAADELLGRYAVDGLHLDRIRYPGSWASYDPESEAAWAALPAPKPARDDWQRDNVTAAVAGIYAAMKTRRPAAVLSASVWGIYKRLPGCSTSEGYPQYFQDSIGWMKAGKIDAIVPMIYWDIGTGCTDWSKLLDGFLAGAAGRPVIAGMHALDMSEVRPARLTARVDYARRVGAAGTSVFASTYLDQPPSGSTSGDSWAVLRGTGGVFSADAAVPPITWR